MTRVLHEMIRMEPQPRNGPPVRIAFTNRGQQYWYNERIGFRRGRGSMLFEWKCPFGLDGKPTLVEGVWYWCPLQRKEYGDGE